MSQPNSVYPPTGYANHVEPENVIWPTTNLFIKSEDGTTLIDNPGLAPESEVTPAVESSPNPEVPVVEESHHE